MMIKNLIGIESVGFDLDGTLYKPNDEVNEQIRRYACERASELLGRKYDEVRSEFNIYFLDTQSASQSLVKLGIENGKEIMQEALEKADIASILGRDERLADLIVRLAENYKLFLITSSPERNALAKLNALGINSILFSPKLYGDSEYIRDDGSAFNYVSGEQSVLLSQMMFVGDRKQTDIIPAKRWGMRTAIVNARSKEADYQLDSIYDLEGILLR